MIKAEFENIKNAQGLQIGRKLKLIGEFRRGAPSQEIIATENKVAEIKSAYLSEVVVLDFSELVFLDSIGIRNTIPLILSCNQDLIKRHRPPIAIVGDTSKDIFQAIKDKFPDRDLENLLP